MTIESFSPMDTFNLAFDIAKKSKPKDVYCLLGDLGVGKTVFVKGFAAGLDISEDVSSPTFTLINEYAASIPLYHFDAYRLDDSEYYDLFLEYLYGDGICLIEWANHLSSIIPSHAVWINIKKDFFKDSNYRIIEF